MRSTAVDAHLGAASAAVLLAPRSEGCGLSCSLALHPQQGLLHWHKHYLQGVVRFECSTGSRSRAQHARAESCKEGTDNGMPAAASKVICDMI